MLLESLHEQVALNLHRQLRALSQMSSPIRAAEILETRLKQHGMEASAVGVVGVLGASVHVVVQADPRQVAHVLAAHSYAFDRDLARDDALTHPFTVRIDGCEVALLVTHLCLEEALS